MKLEPPSEGFAQECGGQVVQGGEAGRQVGDECAGFAQLGLDARRDSALLRYRRRRELYVLHLLRRHVGHAKALVMGSDFADEILRV